MTKTADATIKLPLPNHQGKISVEEAILKRRSIRRFSEQPLSMLQLSQLLWAAQGITGSSGRRSVPSAGATYPLEVFTIVGERGVDNLAAGIYHYQTDGHYLSLHLNGDSRQKLAAAALNQNFIANCPINIIVCALYSRTAYRYGRRAERYVHMEAGHVGQNVALQAVALGLATVMVGAFDDEEVRKVLKVEEQIRPLYIIPVGKPL